MIMCNECFCENKIHDTFSFDVKLENGIMMIVNNVPCLKCPKCGEVLVTDDVSEQLEIMSNKVKNVAHGDIYISYPDVLSGDIRQVVEENLGETNEKNVYNI